MHFTLPFFCPLHSISYVYYTPFLMHLTLNFLCILHSLSFTSLHSFPMPHYTPFLMPLTLHFLCLLTLHLFCLLTLTRIFLPTLTFISSLLSPFLPPYSHIFFLPIPYNSNLSFLNTPISLLSFILPLLHHLFYKRHFLLHLLSPAWS